MSPPPLLFYRKRGKAQAAFADSAPSPAAVKSALQSGDFKNASAQAANLVRYSPAGEAKQKAVILSAEIFSDYGNYDAAVELLAPYTKGRDNFAAQTTFMTAKLYERQNKIDAADELYRRIYENLSRSEYAEEAMYRSGEVYYSNSDYSKAYSRFNSYVYKYSAGRFSDAALFYCADCALRLGDNDRSIMLNKTLLQKFPSSVYAYGANKNLLEAYYKQEEYSQALTVARGMASNRSFTRMPGLAGMNGANAPSKPASRIGAANVSRNARIVTPRSGASHSSPHFIICQPSLRHR